MPFIKRKGTHSVRGGQEGGQAPGLSHLCTWETQQTQERNWFSGFLSHLVTASENYLLTVACSLSPVAKSRAHSLAATQAFPSQWLLLLRSTGSGARAQCLWLRCPMCPALAGGFLTAGPPGKSLVMGLLPDFQQ